MTLEQRYSKAINTIGGAAGLLNLPEQVKEVFKNTKDLETKVKMLELTAEATIDAKRAEFGTGEAIYTTADDFPAEIEHYGRRWYRTEYEYTTVDTGMKNYRYETFDTDRDIRLFVDAAGHIWNEEELGIL